ncbi:MAG: GspH/FimT family pseudopilin [Planctomycetota bacterium]|jgi:type IV fimbrial biogenesis protein FimT
MYRVGNKRRLIKSSGFTLIELVITVSIIALTLAFSGPSLARYAKSQQIKHVAKEVYANLQLCRMTAIKENNDVNVSLDLTAGNASMTMTRSGGTVPVLQTMNFVQDVPNIDFDSSRDGSITFQPNGRIGAGQNQTISVVSLNPTIVTQYDVVINNLGRVRFARIQ